MPQDNRKTQFGRIFRPRDAWLAKAPPEPIIDPDLPIIDMAADRVVLPVRGVAEDMPAQVSPIKPAWQRWNDYGIGCFIEGGIGEKKGEFRQAEEAFRAHTTGDHAARWKRVRTQERDLVKALVGDDWDEKKSADEEMTRRIGAASLVENGGRAGDTKSGP